VVVLMEFGILSQMPDVLAGMVLDYVNPTERFKLSKKMGPSLLKHNTRHKTIEYFKIERTIWPWQFKGYTVAKQCWNNALSGSRPRCQNKIYYSWENYASKTIPEGTYIMVDDQYCSLECALSSYRNVEFFIYTGGMYTWRRPTPCDFCGSKRGQLHQLNIRIASGSTRKDTWPSILICRNCQKIGRNRGAMGLAQMRNRRMLNVSG